MEGSVSWRDRWKYRFDNFMSKGGLSIFLALLTLFAISFAILGGVRLVSGWLFADEAAGETGDMLWRAFLQVTDAGAVAEDGDSSWLNKAIGILTIAVGLVLFSSLVAFITAQFDAKLAELRKGKSSVVETGHTLILGFGERCVEIIRELITANESESRAAVVVLSETPKDEMDDYFLEQIPERKTTLIITRSGTASHLATLKRMGVDRARSVIVLNQAGAADSQDVKSMADARVLKSIMAVVAATSGGRTPPIVADFHMESHRKLADSVSPGNVTTLAEKQILAKLFVQTSRISGLAVVYSNLVGFDGSEIYFFKPEGGWGSKTYADIQMSFPETVPIGFRTADGKILLNPKPDFAPAEGDEGIVFAEDDSKIGYSQKIVATSDVASIPGHRVSVGPERQMLYGWGQKGPMIVEEYAKFLPKGSDIDVVVPAANEGISTAMAGIHDQYPNVRLKLVEADVEDPEMLAQLKPESYNNVILLAGDGNNAEEIDAATIMHLLGFRKYFKDYEARTGRPVATQLITEVMDSENTELIFRTGVKDFLISNQFVSKIFAQVSQEPDVMRVYDDLFCPEGSEIYVKPVTLYFSQFPAQVTFADIMKAAQLREECCFGVKIAAEEALAEKNYGVRLVIGRSEVLTLEEGDALVVLAEDET